MKSTVSIFTEIPETLHESLKNYLETHPDWDENRVLTAALSLFLLQNGDSDRRAARVYLETLFHHSTVKMPSIDSPATANLLDTP
ncbi:DUF2811 domain-containing protein [Nostoc sp. FACHB-892]|jgi:predicted TPR repeat methyltransferase|nr:DUF2811 domain-containing protein [Nostoc sp. C3-bin3]MBD2246109.1 DUF2811 domain-containing protein [Nostoc sp. FACHB-888]MBD2727083.1 DUF2811 domain-containing protein [Nostoc sp. FACHB-892]MBW4427454.1 DUF2811 domain-containing protein [Nostoc desertorum CM1-VF14]MBW4455237.1 DUF2811 domain-containing protein [Nostoc indistinguendum CM1-VF10]